MVLIRSCRRAAATAVTCLATLALPAPASAAFLSQNGLLVVPQGALVFDVPYRGKPSPQAFWCAAGDYARRELRAPNGTRIYRVSPPPRRSGEGIRFSLRPSDSNGRTGLVQIGGSGGLSVGHANALCAVLRQRGDF